MIKKYGSIEQSPQYPVMRRFAQEGKVTVFSIDKESYTKKLPRNCSHYQIPNKLLFIMLAWLIVGLVSKRESIKYLYYFSGSSMFALPFANRISGAKSILSYGCMLWSSGQNFDWERMYAPTLKETLLWLFERRALRYADFVIKGSQEMNAMLVYSSFKGKELDICKGVRSIKPKNWPKRNPKRIIFVGWLEPIKDPCLLINAFTMHVKDSDARLVLCGDGNLMSDCELLSWFDKRVKLLGQRHDIPDQLQRSGIFVNCSRYEAHSDSIIEAMFRGLPVIASNIGGNPDIVVDGITGRLFQKGNAKELGDLINHLLENPFKAELMGKDGRRIAKKKYDLDKNLNKLVGMMKNGAF